MGQHFAVPHRNFVELVQGTAAECRWGSMRDGVNDGTCSHGDGLSVPENRTGFGPACGVLYDDLRPALTPVSRVRLRGDVYGAKRDRAQGQAADRPYDDIIEVIGQRRWKWDCALPYLLVGELDRSGFHIKCDVDSRAAPASRHAGVGWAKVGDLVNIEVVGARPGPTIRSKHCNPVAGRDGPSDGRVESGDGDPDPDVGWPGGPKGVERDRDVEREGPVPRQHGARDRGAVVTRLQDRPGDGGGGRAPVAA